MKTSGLIFPGYLQVEFIQELPKTISGKIKRNGTGGRKNGKQLKPIPLIMMVSIK